jgi:DNA-binding LacI/PurR family transcriptional regulator
LLSSQVDGIVVAGGHLPQALLDTLGADVPLVCIGRAVRSSTVADISSDDRRGSRLAVAHLAALGHHRITHLDGGRSPAAAARRAGYIAAMRENGRQQFVAVQHADTTEAAGAAAVGRLLADGAVPTALFVASDLAAVGALDRLADAGLRVPEDVSIVGYGNTELAALAHFGLTTVAEPLEEMGHVAVRTLLERIIAVRSGATVIGRVAIRSGSHRGLHHVLSPELVVRRTTRPPAR